MRRCLLFVLIAVWMNAVAANEELDAMFDKDTLIVVVSGSACHRFDIYLAIDNRQRARGLMHVRSLPDMTGMLFVYDGDEFISMWMKNTYIPLDIVFARADGSVSSIATNTEPLSLRSIRSVEPVKFVLELNAGTTARLAINKQSRLIWEPAHGANE